MASSKSPLMPMDRRSSSTPAMSAARSASRSSRSRRKQARTASGSGEFSASVISPRTFSVG